MPIPPAPGTATSKPGAARGAPPRPNVADQLERLTSRFDELADRARRATTHADIDDVDELILEFCRDLRAVARPPAPRAAPLYVTPCGTGALF